MSGLGEREEAPEPDLPHVASLQLRPHEEREGPLPPPVQPQLRRPVVCHPKPGRPPVRLPAAPRPQETVPHGPRQAKMLRSAHANVCAAALNPCDDFHFLLSDV